MRGTPSNAPTQALITATRNFFASQLGVDPDLVEVVVVVEGAQRRMLLRDVLQSPRMVELDVAIEVPNSEVANVASQQLLETKDADISTYMAETGVAVGSVSKGEVQIVHITLNVSPAEGTEPSGTAEKEVVVEKKSGGFAIAGAAIGGAAGSAVLAGVVAAVIIIRRRRKRSAMAVSPDTEEVRGERQRAEWLSPHRNTLPLAYDSVPATSWCSSTHSLLISVPDGEIRQMDIE